MSTSAARRLDILSCHPGKHHFYEQAYYLSQHFSSFRFLTSLFVEDRWIRPLRRIAPPLYEKLRRRSHFGLLGRFVDLNLETEIRILGSRLLRRPYSYYEGNERFGRWVVSRYAPPKILIAVDTASRALFREWKGKSFLVLDLTIALPSYRVKVYSDARARSAGSVDFYFPEAAELELYREEVDLADLILCGSEFVRESCLDAGVPPERLKVIEYGVDLDVFRFDPSRRQADGVLRVAFVGNFDYRKGAHILLEAFRRLRRERSDVELHVFGGVPIPVSDADRERVVFHGFVSQDALARGLRRCDIMAFPTLFEGSAYSVYQAMALGLPVVTTLNSGSIVDSECGVIIPTNSPEQLFEAMKELLADPSRRRALGERGRAKVQGYTWKRYGDQLAETLRVLLERL